VMREVAASMPNASRIRVPNREHINAFLYSEFVVPKLMDFLVSKRKVASA
jgi:hypothetical protein